MSTPFRIIVGLEVHVELQTQTKMFCRCKNDPFDTEANTHVCPVCLGLPGALPTPNQEAIKSILLLGKALGSEPNSLSRWDRKHYFYPDLPKGYQISQLDLPFCVGGSIDLLADDGSVEKTVRFERAHLEEDAGKLMHGSTPGYSNVDLNRAGVPLVEMVSLPDLENPAQARKFLQELQLLVRTLGISNADMEKGQMRCDVNINIAFIDPVTGKEVRTPITEVKNVNSSRAVERSIATESQRQYDEWIAGGPITSRKGKITAGWDEDKERVNVQRAKEGSADYRYMPEPDLPPVEVFKSDVLNPNNLKLPKLPNEWRKELLAEGVGMTDINVLLADEVRLGKLNDIKDLRDEVVKVKTVVNWLVNAAESVTLVDQNLIELIRLADEGKVSFSAVKAKLHDVSDQIRAGSSVEEAIKTLGLLQEHDEAVVKSAIEAVLAEHAQVVADYKAGNERMFGFLVGQVMKRCQGKAQPARVNEALKEAIR